MIKTLHVIGSRRPGGAEGFYIRLLNALQQSGWQPEALLRHGSLLANELDDSVKQHFAAMYSHWDGWSQRQVNRKIQHLQPQLVQTYMGRATRLTQLQNSAIVHIARLGGYYNLKAYLHADAWVVNTKKLRDYLIQNGFPATRVFHIYNFIDFPEHPVPEARLSGRIPEDAWVLLAVARLEPIKGIEYLLNAIAQLPITIAGRPLHLVVLGDGFLKEELMQQARQLVIAERVHWAGWQRETAPYFQRADLVVFPSLLKEAFGNVIIESWSHQKPILTSESYGAYELCQHGVDAWCVPCANEDTLAHGIKLLLEDDQLRRELAEAGHQQARQKFNKASILESYQAMYYDLVNT